ncbi:MAG: hypothetical protein ABH858_00625 [Candidatus Omnitrophota bacterium]
MTKLYKWIVYSGIIAFVLLSLTIILGAFSLSYNLHIAIGTATFVFACLHVGLVIFKNYRVKKRR